METLLIPEFLTEAQLQRIDNGVKLLDDRLGFNWAMAIDLKIFDINSFSRCVLGQVFGCYSDGLARLKLADDDAAAEYGLYPHKEDTPHNFDIYSPEAAEYADGLSELKNVRWKELIKQRQNVIHSEKLP